MVGGGFFATRMSGKRTQAGRTVRLRLMYPNGKDINYYEFCMIDAHTGKMYIAP